MHDFVSYLFYLLQRGMRFAVPAALVCGLILAVCYAVCRKKGRRFPWGKAVCAVLLVGWAVITVFVTLLRSEPNEFAARQCNLQLFLAWREAYQRFTLQIWLNVLLNIALFVPLGVLLPLLWKPFRKWYAALGAGFGVSLLIELTQLFTGSGMCDVDDLFTNTLGAMLGWCAAMLVLALHQKSRTWPRYCALPAAFALALSAIFISYAAQPYGNLRDASVTTADLSGVRWSVDFALDEDSKTAYVYQAQALDNVGADRFAAEFAAAVSAGVDAAYKAVMKPAEGTILTVSRLGAQAAVAFAKDSTDFEGMLDALLVAAREALADTQNINPVLRRAGVVDAGGEGFVLVMDAMLGYLQGRTAAPVTAAAPAAAQAPKEGADFSEFDTGEITFGYCTEFIVARENSKSPELLRSFLKNLGDCVVVVDDDEIIKVHVHTNVPGEVLTEALTYGPLQTVKIENMRNQHTALSGKEAAPAAAEAEAEAEPEVAKPEKQFGVVAVSAGEGMANLFRELGVDRVVTGGQTMNPSTEDILTEVNKTPAEVVFVLPNNKNIIMAAQQCIPLSDKKVIVIPTKTVPQGITAMLSFDPASAEDVIEAELSAAIESVHTAQITYAARDSDFDGHDIHKGEYLALMDGALLGSDADLDKVLTRIADAANDLDPEIVSIYYGEDVQGDAAQHAADLLGERLPMADVNVVDGGQPVYYYMISFE